MLRFFRVIREKLLLQGKVRAYLLYAVGEILLVVIGILIALQVNNWNEERRSEKEAGELLSSLHNEFQQNRALIGQSQKNLNGVIESGMQLMNLIGKSRAEMMNVNIDSLFFRLLPPTDFTISNASVNNITQSGKLNLIQDQELINKIYEWETIMNYVKMREEKTDTWTNEVLLPYMSEHMSFKKMDTYGGYVWTGESNLNYDPYSMFQDLKFENYMDNTLFFNQTSLNGINRADTLSMRILELTRAK